MAEMTEREFVSRFINDKAFKREIAAAVMDYEGEEGSETGMGDLMAVAAKNMGYELDAATLDREVEAQLAELSTFQKIRVLGSFINAGRKNKKARDKAAKKAAKGA